MQNTNNPRFYKGIERPLYTPDAITSLKPDEVFVFGSNLQGHHGGGAARAAQMRFGAIWGQGVGLQGQSYAIPTMQGGVKTIKPYVDQFITFAKEHPELFFYVTRIGCGIAGFKDKDIAPLFTDALVEENICLPESFIEELQNENAKMPFFKRVFGIKKDNSVQEPKNNEVSDTYPNSEMVIHYGQVRTMADILIGLDEVRHFSSSSEAIDEVENYIASQNQGHSSISAMAFHVIADTLQSPFAFKNGKLNDNEIKRVFEQAQFQHAWENALYKYRFAKLWKLICYFDEFRRYNSPLEILEDLKLVNLQHYFYMTDSAYGAGNKGLNGYPWHFFKSAIYEMWDSFAPDGTLNPKLLEQYMFENHEISLRTIGLEATIKKDFLPNGCWEAYYPKLRGSAPVYIERMIGDKRRFIKSCGEGAGPNQYPESLEIGYAVKVLLIKDHKYEIRGEYDAYHVFDPIYFVPKTDMTLPFYDMHGKIIFENDEQKYLFINNELSKLYTPNKNELNELKDSMFKYGFY